MAFLKTVVTTAVVTLGAAWPASGQANGAPDDPATFLRSLAGEWSVVAEAIPGPGLEPVRSESVEVARLLGETWLIAESEVASPDGTPVTSILTLGYDSSREGFVGTFVSSMQEHLWSYSGELDDAGTTLTLETEGPVLGDPTRTTAYRDIIEVVSTDRRVMRSMILGPDGEWFEFARAEYRRVE